MSGGRVFVDRMGFVTDLMGFVTDFARISVLALAIEILYLVPYGLPYTLRTMFREAFGLTDGDLAKMASSYGLVSMCLYIPGGYIADRFEPKVLLAAAFLTTAACCLYIIKVPSVTEFIIVWAVLGAAGTFLFWSAFISAIRQIGGEQHTGKAFGFEQLSRGLWSSLLIFFAAAWIQAMLTPHTGDGTSATSQHKLDVMLQLIWRLAGLETLAAVLVFLVAPSRTGKHNRDRLAKNRPVGPSEASANGIGDFMNVLRRPAVWLHALIVICAYSCNLATGYFPGLGTRVYGMSDVEAAKLTTVVTTMRAFAGFPAGVAADRCGRAYICCSMFLICVCAYVWVALTLAGPVQQVPMSHSATATLPPIHVLVMQIATCAASVYGIAGVYFTLLDDAQLPLELTGSAVGMVSVVGFSPDIFLGYLVAYWLDSRTDRQGYASFYLCVAAIGALGFLMTLLFAYVVRSQGGGEYSEQVPSSDSTHGMSGSTVSQTESAPASKSAFDVNASLEVSASTLGHAEKLRSRRNM